MATYYCIQSWAGKYLFVNIADQILVWINNCLIFVYLFVRLWRTRWLKIFNSLESNGSRSTIRDQHGSLLKTRSGKMLNRFLTSTLKVFCYQEGHCGSTTTSGYTLWWCECIFKNAENFYAIYFRQWSRYSSLMEGQFSKFSTSCKDGETVFSSTYFFCLFKAFIFKRRKDVRWLEKEHFRGYHGVSAHCLLQLSLCIV